jgi:hypothetical protein
MTSKDVGEPNTPPAADIVPLFNDLKIPGNTTMSFISATPIEVSKGVFISSPGPITISTSEPMWVFPHAPLTKAFADGWTKLPDELKVQILSNLIPSSNFLFRDPSYLKKRVCWKELQHYSQMTPEIRCLATQIFYRSNMFRLTVLDWLTAGTTPVYLLRYPKPVVNMHIQRLELDLGSLSPGSWQKLKNLSDGVYGFPALLNLRVLIDFQSPSFVEQPFTYQALAKDAADVEVRWQAFLDKVIKSGVSFECAGSAEICSGDFCYIWKVTPEVLAQMEQQLLSRIVFKEAVKEG